MKTPILLLLLSLVIPSPALSRTFDSLSKGLSLHVERKSKDVLISSSGLFSAGFYNVGDNAYCFAIWFTNSNSASVWMANRDSPVNGLRSELSLLEDGNLVLSDAGRNNVWSTNTPSTSSKELRLLNTGNLALLTSGNAVVWQSFDHPTNTLLPHQLLTRATKLVSSRSRQNYSSGFYSLHFDSDNVLHLLFDGQDTSSIYWPDPSKKLPDLGRSTFNSTRVASFDPLGHFQSSDGLKFFAADFGIGPIRRLTLDFDGNLRLYSLDEKKRKWQVSWQALNRPCKAHGLCGTNSLCVHEPSRRCSCLSGFKLRDPTDWSLGCEPKFELSCDDDDVEFVTLPTVDFYGYDVDIFQNVTFQECRKICVKLCSCKAFLYRRDKGVNNCFPKTSLRNGFRSDELRGTVYLKLNKDGLKFYNESTRKSRLTCSKEARVELPRIYEAIQDTRYVKYLPWFVGIIGGIEMMCIFVGWYYLFRPEESSSIIQQGYLFVGLKKFTYAELKKATKGFSQEIGKGGGGTVYKGVLPDGRVAAIKKLNEAKQEEGEFFAEVRTIGRINHMNLIEMWGFCAEKKHRLLVYEYMELGSLAENLSSSALDWEKRYEIAVSTAKGLAYLHEECLEWVIHCDVKPQNILLDVNHKPKVADFGLSILLDRSQMSDPEFSAIRGTRGYIAPEWVYNPPITSKVDVYSYGVVVLEMITGKSPTVFHPVDDVGAGEQLLLVNWVREKINSQNNTVNSPIEEIMDSRIDDQYDVVKMENLVRVALLCVEEEINARPTMSQVVKMLMDYNTHDYHTVCLSYAC